MKSHKSFQSFAFLITLGLLLSLTACENQPENNSEQELPETTGKSAVLDHITSDLTGLAELRNAMEPSGAIAGILYLGFGEEGLLSDSIQENILEKSYHRKYPFLQEIASSHIVVAEGYELYCIIPADPAASVNVNAWDAETGAAGETLYESSEGTPFLLMCNTSDIMSNVTVSITDSKGAVLSLYSPGISLRDGCVLLPGEDQPVVLDLTSY